MGYLQTLPARCTLFAFLVAIIITWKRLEDTGFFDQIHEGWKQTKKSYKSVFNKIKNRRRKNETEKTEE